MDWFSKLKQHNTANDDYQMQVLSNKELDDFIEGIPTDKTLALRVFKGVTYNNLLADALRAVRKTSKKQNLPLLHCVAAAAFAGVDMVRQLLETLEKYNPAGTELIKRKLKEKVAKW